MRAGAALILIAALLPGCREERAEAPSPVPLTEDSVSHFCQMNVLEHGGPKAQVHLEGVSAPLFFAQVRDGIAFLKSPERDARVLISYVSDMGAASSWDDPGPENWIPAETAFFVIEAGVRGGMGAPEIAPFAQEDKAASFAARHGGRVVRLQEIPDDAVLGPVDALRPLETPS